jgi:hypothetical protein
MSYIDMPKTYACRCGKKHAIPLEGNSNKCGCGRTATTLAGRVTIKDKEKR